MLTIYDESILQELYEMGSRLNFQTDKYMTTFNDKGYIVPTEIENIEKLLGLQYVETTPYFTLWRKLKLEE